LLPFWYKFGQIQYQVNTDLFICLKQHTIDHLGVGFFVKLCSHLVIGVFAHAIIEFMFKYRKKLLRAVKLIHLANESVNFKLINVLDTKD
jgi:hypothetical protein